MNAGEIQKHYTVDCSNCGKWFGLTLYKRHNAFVRLLERTGWKFLRDTGWTCGDCYHKLSAKARVKANLL